MGILYLTIFIIIVITVPILIVLYLDTSDYDNLERRTNLGLFFTLVWFFLTLFLMSKIVQ